MKYKLSLYEPLELQTTATIVGKIIIDFQFSDSDDQELTISCEEVTENVWKYSLESCMDDSNAMVMSGVPNVNFKTWLITQTLTNLIVECNGVTVVDFNFEADKQEGFDDCQKLWTSELTAIYFEDANGMFGNDGTMIMRNAFTGKNSQTNE